MKLVVVIACVMATAFGQTADGNAPQYTAVTESETGTGGARRFDQSESGADSVDPSTIEQFGIQHGAYGNNSLVEENANERVQFRNKTLTYRNSSYGKDGNLLPPPSSIEYDPAAAQSSCLTSCASKYASSSVSGHCEDGCKTWMAYSSLNWEETWRPKLKTRCYKQCLQRRKWTHLLGDKAKHDAELRNDFTKSYWSEKADTSYTTAPYDRQNKLPFYTAHHCTVNTAATDCTGSNFKCSTDHKLVNDDVDECINEAEVACKYGCDEFATAQCAQDNTGC